MRTGFSAISVPSISNVTVIRDERNYRAVGFIHIVKHVRNEATKLFGKDCVLCVVDFATAGMVNASVIFQP